MPEVRVKRTELMVPTPDDPERKIFQVEYRSGELPPRFLFIPAKDWTKEKETEMIKADIQARLTAPEETIEV